MKLQCVLTFFVAISSSVTATSEEEFYGTWTMVQFFGDPSETISDEVSTQCVTNKISRGETKCTCDGVELVTFNVSQFDGVMIDINITGAIADSHKKAILLERSSCQDNCGLEFKVFRKLNNNYFVMYFSAKRNRTPDTALFAKSVPTLTVLDAFVNNIKDFDDKVKITFCVNNSTR